MTKVGLFYIVLGSVVVPLAHARETLLLADNWRFQLGDNPQANARDFADDKWRLLSLPHDWSIEGKTDAAAPSKGHGGYFPTGIGWYRRELTADPAWRGKRMWLDFEDVATRCEVWLNGEKLGGHHYAYTPFRFDISEKLDFEKPNVIAVRVDNSHQPNSRWYTGSGIYRHVWLTVIEPVYVEHNTFRLTTRVIDRFPPSEGKTKTLTARVVNKSDQSRDVRAEFTVRDSNNQLVVQNHDNVSIVSAGVAIGSMDFDISNLQKWSPEAPNLYTAMVRIVADKQVLDESSFRFGIRTVEVSADKGFLVNGRPVELCGACVHHDNGPLGAAAFDRAEERRVELLKAAGFNAIRTAHNPPSTAFLDACDRLGMLVIDEAFDGWSWEKTPHDYSEDFEEKWREDLTAMVRRDCNHPCVVMWSIGNEVYERGDPLGAKIGRDMVQVVRDLDPTRPITLAANGLGDDAKWPQLDGLFAPLDVAGYNYEVDRIVPDHDRLPSRVIFSSESFQSEAFACWDAAEKHSYMIGDFVWSGLDYLGEAGIGRVFAPDEKVRQHWEGEHFPWHGAYCGDLDITGWRKPISHYRNVIWDRGEKLYVAVVAPTADGRPWGLGSWAMPTALASWTWPGAEGRELQVEVYSRHEVVRLYLNDELIGEKPTGREQEFKAMFAVPYAPGTLKAVGIANAQEVEDFEIVTAGPASKLKVSVDRDVIRADGQDLAFVTVELTDDTGNINRSADQLVDYRLQGPGSIVAIGSGDLTSQESYRAKPRSTYQGRALVVVRSTNTPGKIKLTAKAAGLEPAMIEIKSETEN